MKKSQLHASKNFRVGVEMCSQEGLVANATWPLGHLAITDTGITISAALLGDVFIKPSELIALQRIGWLSPFNGMIRIRHNSEALPALIIISAPSPNRIWDALVDACPHLSWPPGGEGGNVYGTKPDQMPGWTGWEINGKSVSQEEGMRLVSGIGGSLIAALLIFIASLFLPIGQNIFLFSGLISAYILALLLVVFILVKKGLVGGAVLVFERIRPVHIAYMASAWIVLAAIIVLMLR